jgi:hypothetical protein
MDNRRSESARRRSPSHCLARPTVSPLLLKLLERPGSASPCCMDCPASFDAESALEWASTRMPLQPALGPPGARRNTTRYIRSRRRYVKIRTPRERRELWPSLCSLSGNCAEVSICRPGSGVLDGSSIVLRTRCPRVVDSHHRASSSCMMRNSVGPFAVGATNVARCLNPARAYSFVARWLKAATVRRSEA